MKNIPQTLVNHYEKCFMTYGATHKGVDWPKEHDAKKRLDIMLSFALDALANSPLSVLDLGCGYGALLDQIINHNLDKKLVYHGVDLSEPMIQYAQQQHSEEQFEIRNIFTHPFSPSSFDIVIMNGVLTEKQNIPHDVMVEYAKKLIETAFHVSRYGVAFNVMSPQVDYKRADLFYWSFDNLASFVAKQCSRHFCFRQDYGLYEYTVYLYKDPTCSRDYQNYT